METFTAARAFVANPRYHKEREESLRALDFSGIDDPIIEIIKSFAGLKYCFTLQSCFGHFLYPGQTDPYNTEPLPVNEIVDTIEYRIAYLALCLEDNAPGRKLFDDLRNVTSIDPKYVQYGSADWFWERHLNAYVLQVEPEEHMTRDRCRIDHQEALHVEMVRDRFFDELAALVEK